MGETRNILEAMPPEQRSRLLGDIVTLMTLSPAHADYKSSILARWCCRPCS